jgi:hypothetical protein
MSARTVAVYNAGGTEYLHHVKLKNAIRNIVNNKYRVLREAPGDSAYGDIPRPEAVELVRYRYAREKYDLKGEVPFSRRGVLRRDNYTCAYCGKYGDTVDHILPKWRGNDATWMNSITACFPCNNKKGGRSPKEAGMPLQFTPHVPSFAEAFKWTKVGRTQDDVVR